jgi:hypothetical protein
MNDRETRQQRLRNGDVVTVGRFRLRLIEGKGPEGLPPAGDFGETVVLPPDPGQEPDQAILRERPKTGR